MKYYLINPDFLSLWGEDCTEDTVIDDAEVERLAAEWEKPVEELLAQLEEAPFSKAYEHLIDKCHVKNASGHWCWTFTKLSMDEVGWIVEHCPSWDYLSETDDSGSSLYDFAPVCVNGTRVWMQTAAALMDDEIREALHAEGIADPQEFIDAYCKAHREKYGEDFAV